VVTLAFTTKHAAIVVGPWLGIINVNRFLHCRLSGSIVNCRFFVVRFDGCSGCDSNGIVSTRLASFYLCPDLVVSRMVSKLVWQFLFVILGLAGLPCSFFSTAYNYI
jgi:hypothetical protein